MALEEEEREKSEAHAAELSRMAWSIILGGGLLGAPSLTAASSLGAGLYAAGPGGWRLVKGADGNYHYQQQTTQVAVDTIGFQNYQTVLKISKEVGLSSPDPILRQEWYASRDLPAKDSEGFRQTIVDAVNYLEQKNPQILKDHPELGELRDQTQKLLETYKTPEDYLKALADTNNHDLDRYRELINKPETYAYISGTYIRQQLDKPGYTERDAGAEVYLIRRLGEARAKEIFSQSNPENISPFLTEDMIKADPSLADLKDLSAHDIIEVAKSKMDIGVAPAVNSMKLDAASMNTLGGRQRMAMDILVSKYQAEGYSFDQAAIFAAGHVANFLHESPSLNVREVGDSGLARGIGQWHPDRQAGFQEHFGYAMDKPPPDMPLEVQFQHQVEWSYLEPTDVRDREKLEGKKYPEGKEYVGGGRFRSATNAFDAGYDFSKYVVRPGDVERQATTRGREAEKVLADYKAGLAANPSGLVSNEPGSGVYTNGFNPVAAQQYADTVTKLVSGSMCVDGTGRFLAAGGLSIPRKPNEWGEYNNTFTQNDWLLKNGYHRVTDNKIAANYIIHFPKNEALGLHGHWEYITSKGEVKSDFAQRDTPQHSALYPNAQYQAMVDSRREPMEIYAPDEAPAPSNGPVVATVTQPAPGAVPAPPQQAIKPANTKLSFGLGPVMAAQSHLTNIAFHPSEGVPVRKPGDVFTVNVVGDSLAAQVKPALAAAFEKAGYNNVQINGRGIPSSGLTRGGNESLGLEKSIDAAIVNGGDIVALMGHNDGPKAHSATYREDLDRVFGKLQAAQQNGRNVTIISPLYTEQGTHNLAQGLHDNLVQLETLYKETAAKYGLKYVEANTTGYSRLENTHGVHLDQAGYQKLAEQMMVPGIVNRPAPAAAPNVAANTSTNPPAVAAAPNAPAFPNVAALKAAATDFLDKLKTWEEHQQAQNTPATSVDKTLAALTGAEQPNTPANDPEKEKETRTAANGTRHSHHNPLKDKPTELASAKPNKAPQHPASGAGVTSAPGHVA